MNETDNQLIPKKIGQKSELEDHIDFVWSLKIMFCGGFYAPSIKDAPKPIVDGIKRLGRFLVSLRNDSVINSEVKDADFTEEL